MFYVSTLSPSSSQSCQSSRVVENLLVAASIQNFLRFWRLEKLRRFQSVIRVTWFWQERLRLVDSKLQWYRFYGQCFLLPSLRKHVSHPWRGLRTKLFQIIWLYGIKGSCLWYKNGKIQCYQKKIINDFELDTFQCHSEVFNYAPGKAVSVLGVKKTSCFRWRFKDR